MIFNPFELCATGAGTDGNQGPELATLLLMSILYGLADEQDALLFTTKYALIHQTGAGCSRHILAVSTHACDIGVSKWYRSAFVLESHHARA